MDKIGKAIRKLSKKEQRWVKEVLSRLLDGNFQNLDIKKLKGREDIFRVKRGDIRIIYRKDKKEKIFILAIERRSDTTYRS